MLLGNYIVADATPEFPQTPYHRAYQLHERGQNVTSTDDVQFVWAVGARIGASHFSYCACAETLRSGRTHQASLADPSFKVSPPGIKLLPTFACLYPSWRVLRGLNQ